MSTQSLNKIISNNSLQGNPLEALRVFLDNEIKMEAGQIVDQMRFVGYVLDLGYEAAKIITSDP